MLRARRFFLPVEDTKFLPQLEILEPRLAMTASLYLGDALPPVMTHGVGGCSCPICTGQGLQSLVSASAAQATTTGSGSLSATNPLSALPQLSSNSGAKVKLYLDFNGNFEASWGSYKNVTTKVFDQDGDATTFSTSEISTIREIWARVAEDYAPFNIDVTTVDPGNFANGAAVRLAIGGNYSDWFGQAAGGVAYVGGFNKSASNTGYVFEDALGNGTARYVAEATSHEAGHLFGLLHQSTWVNGQLQNEYNSGNSGWAPIMGVGYYSTRTTWFNGTSDVGANVYQDDVVLLTAAVGLRADDYSNSFSTPSTLPVNGTSVNFAGLIGSRTDVDAFQFSTGGGTVNFQMNVAQFGNNLDGAIEIRNSAGNVISVSDPSNSFGASLSTNLAAGSYFLVVRGSGTFGNSSYGNLGQYTVTGTVPASSNVASPEVTVLVGSTEIADGGTIDFGSTQAGTPVDRIIAVKNVGSANLSVSSITSAIPAGFTLVSNLTTTTLQAGQSVTFTLRLNAAAAGSFSGAVSFANSDANEGTYDLKLQGSVTTTTTSGGAGSTVQMIDDGAAGNSLVGVWKVGTKGRDGDVHVASRSNYVTASSSWTFTNLAPGQYRVYMSWSGDKANASNTPVTLFSGIQSLGTSLINQRVASSGYSASSTNWSLVRSVTLQGSTLTVVLTNKANGNVVADAVRLERVGAASSSLNGAAFDVGGDSDFSGAGILAGTFTTNDQHTGGHMQENQATCDQQHTASHDSVLQDNLNFDLAPELGVLEETLDLVREVNLQVRETESNGGVDGIFSEEQDWLSVL